jgi:hypothetical protein
VTARLVGPRRARAMVLGLSATDESKISDAIGRLRKLISRLAQQGAEIGEASAAEAWSRAERRQAEFDPRRRVVDLWQGNRNRTQATPAGFSRYLSASLGSATVTVLHVHRQL